MPAPSGRGVSPHTPWVKRSRRTEGTGKATLRAAKEGFQTSYGYHMNKTEH